MAELPEVEMVGVTTRIVKENDEDRLNSMCSLLNTFNYAVQVQSGRNQWEPQDFRAFAIALGAMDEIGQAHHAVEHAIESLASRRLRQAE